MEYYIEYIIFQEFVIDFLLLYMIAILLKTKIHIIRIVSATLVGVLYSVLVLVVNQNFLNYFIVKFMISILMITIAHSPKGFWSYFKAVICLYILSLLVFGIVSYSYIVFNSKITIIILFIILFIVYLLFSIIFREAKSNRRNKNYTRDVKIYIRGNSVVVTGLVDTGNELCDSISQRPVIIVKASSLKSLIDKDVLDEIINVYNIGGNAVLDFMIKRLSDYNFRLVKYETIGIVNEYLICIVPDKTVIKDKDKCFPVDCVIGIYNGVLNNEDKYQALLFKNILSWEGEFLNANEYF